MSDETLGDATRLGIGTRGYAPLEQLAGCPPEPAMDVFALGALLLELVDGAPAFADAAAWESALRSDAYPRLRRSDVPLRFGRAIAAALTRRSDRLPDAQALLDAWQDRADPLVAPFRAVVLAACAPPDEAEVLATDPAPLLLPVALRFAPPDALAARVAPSEPHVPLAQLGADLLDDDEADHVRRCARCRVDLLRVRRYVQAPSAPRVRYAAPKPRVVVLTRDGDDEIGSDSCGGIDALIAAHGGRRGQSAVNTVLGVFDGAADAVRYAFALRARLPDQRIGMHGGLVAYPSAGDGVPEVDGPVEDTVARLTALADLGQTIASVDAIDGAGRLAVKGLDGGELRVVVRRRHVRFAGVVVPVCELALPGEPLVMEPLPVSTPRHVVARASPRWHLAADLSGLAVAVLAIGLVAAGLVAAFVADTLGVADAPPAASAVYVQPIAASTTPSSSALPAPPSTAGSGPTPVSSAESVGGEVVSVDPLGSPLVAPVGPEVSEGGGSAGDSAKGASPPRGARPRPPPICHQGVPPGAVPARIVQAARSGDCAGATRGLADVWQIGLDDCVLTQAVWGCFVNEAARRRLDATADVAARWLAANPEFARVPATYRPAAAGAEALLDAFDLDPRFRQSALSAVGETAASELLLIVLQREAEAAAAEGDPSGRRARRVYVLARSLRSPSGQLVSRSAPIAHDALVDELRRITQPIDVVLPELVEAYEVGAQLRPIPLLAPVGATANRRPPTAVRR